MDLDGITIVLDLVKPLGALRRALDERREQRLERRGLAVVEREPDGGDPVLQRPGQLRVARDEPLDGGRVAGLDRGDDVGS